MTASRKGVDSSDTPPLSEAERKAKKEAKKARKEARRAAAAAEGAAEDATEEVAAPKKRKADEVETEESTAAPVEGEKKKKKDKKSKKSKKEDGEAAPVVEEDEEEEAPSAPAEWKSTSVPSTPEIEAFLKENRVSYEPPETATSTFPPVLSFAALPLDEGVRKGLASYTKPTPIQSASFPVMMGGRDVIGIAETGYVAPIDSRRPPPRSLTLRTPFADPERPSRSVSPPSNTFFPSPPPPTSPRTPSQSSSSLPPVSSPCKPTPTSRPSPPPSQPSLQSASTEESPKTNKRRSFVPDLVSSLVLLDVFSISQGRVRSTFLLCLGWSSMRLIVCSTKGSRTIFGRLSRCACLCLLLPCPPLASVEAPPLLRLAW